MPTAYSNPLLEEYPEDGLPEPLFLTPNQQTVRYEKRQCLAEGRDLSSAAEQFDAVLGTETPSPAAVDALFETTRDLPQRPDFEYDEPTGLSAIQAARPAAPRQLDAGPSALADPYDTIYGGWLGSVAGCLLGNPVQGWSRERILGFLQASDQYPLSEYMHSAVTDSVAETYDIYQNIESTTADESTFITDVSGLPVDDDVDYMIAGLEVAKRHGEDFAALDVANVWLRNLPALRTYTAERIAYRNLLCQVLPPDSGVYRNPYREHIGAMIRADPWGYLALGDPERAAELAYRDATVSHTKNGVYGAMWAAALIAAAPFYSDPVELVDRALAEIPAESRFAEGISAIIAMYADRLSYTAAVEAVHDWWNEDEQFDWVHTISNAQILTIGLLWGNADFTESLGLAVQAGFDTDSHGATLGSVLGCMTGASEIPARWTDPLDDRVDTGVISLHRPKLSDLAEQTVCQARAFR